MAALAENPAEHSEDEDVAAPQGPENEPTAKAVPEARQGAEAEDEDAAGDEVRAGGVGSGAGLR